MKSSSPSFLSRFNEGVREAEILLSIARSSDLQIQAIDNLGALLTSISEEKAQAIESQEEELSNLLLGCECVIFALISELRMWLLLKEEKPDKAWDEMINAQMASIDAVRAHHYFSHITDNNKKLEAIERLIFPPQIFLSSGMIVGKQLCSICEEEYGDCDHLVGKPYMGSFCYIVAKEVSIDHLSIVEHPADKRCRVQEFSDDGVNRNRMTWKIVQNDEK